jgi:hypothetical protein
MNAYPNAPLAWDRTRQMARRLGVDLPRAVFDGWLTRRDLDGLLCACEACGKPGCGTQEPPDLPGLCWNHCDLESLRL